jgi:hypothetical protein
MTPAETRMLIREHIADLFNHGLSNAEVVQALNSSESLVLLGFMVSKADLIDVIRDLMEEKPKEEALIATA